MFSSISRSAVALGMVMVLLVLGCGGIGYWSARNTQKVIGDLGSVTLVVQRHMEADMMHDAIRADIASALAALDPASGISMAESLAAISTDSTEFRANIAEARANARDPAVLAALGSVDTPLRDYIAAADDMQRRLKDDPRRAAAHYPTFLKSFRTLEAAMSNASEAIETHTTTQGAREVATAEKVRIIMLVAVLASLLLLAGAGVLVRNILVKPLTLLGAATDGLARGDYAKEVPETNRRDEIGTVARALVALRDAGRQKVALEQEAAASQMAQQAIVGALGVGLANLREGDFTKTLDGEYAAEYRVLQDNFNHAVGALRELMQIVNEITMGIRSGSERIAASADEVSRRTEGNAASLEETSAALVQIDGRLKTSASASRSTVARANQAIATVDDGRAIAVEAVAAMSRVRDSAKGIDDVIEGLDKIAFQTRVLAMNAAVEAGRAGDAGRGFAVVADLVSALAMRAEAEAKRARDQLTVTQNEVLSAVTAVERVDGALAGIAGDVSAVHTLLETMASDNQMQAQAVTEITATVGSMDQATQTNAAMVEQTALAARGLHNDVNLLVEKAEIFSFERRKLNTPVAVQRRAA